LSPRSRKYPQGWWLKGKEIAKMALFEAQIATTPAVFGNDEVVAKREYPHRLQV